MTDIAFRRAKIQCLSPKGPSKDFADARNLNRVTGLSPSAVCLNKRSVVLISILEGELRFSQAHLHIVCLETGLLHDPCIQIGLGRSMWNCDVSLIFALIHRRSGNDS